MASHESSVFQNTETHACSYPDSLKGEAVETSLQAPLDLEQPVSVSQQVDSEVVHGEHFHNDDLVRAVTQPGASDL